MVKNLTRRKLHYFQVFFNVTREAHVIFNVSILVIKLRNTCIYIAQASLSIRLGTKEKCSAKRLEANGVKNTHKKLYYF
jgi:hypothetical protein